MAMKKLNAFLKKYVHHTNNVPLWVFITGASGAGKTFLTGALEQKLNHKYVEIAYFDRISVPPLEEMVKKFGSGEKWQEKMTHERVQKLKIHKDKKILLLEGQFNLQFALEACKEFKIQDYLLILLHANRKTREFRLIEQRAQPELANDTMENWALFLRRKTLELGGNIIDTSRPNLASPLNELTDLILKRLTVSSSLN
ncbi:MAG: hypothetical protein BGO67_02625 [Alphaproteobacteria bacterium 41-28]|nr:MAG: hypothetical protein BGO67_02625 [Alphaproteobacteria bacterium 41-28]